MNGNGHEPDPRPYLDEPVDDAGNAMCLFKTTHGHYKYCTAYGWMHWNGRYYATEGAEQVLVDEITTMLRKRVTDLMYAGRGEEAKRCIPNVRAVNAVMTMFVPRAVVSIDDFDANPYTLNCMNGEVDLRTGTLKPHDPSMLYTYCVNAEYDPHADTFEWEEWLAGVIEGGEDMVKYLQTLVGYTFTGLTREELFVYLWGPTRSGKGTFTETLLALAGRPLGVGAKMSTFTEKRNGSDQNFDLAPLKAARFVVASESESTDWLNAAKVKNMTGGDYITCAFKHKDQFSYRPLYTIWLISNHPIQTDAEDDAIWGRARVLCFPNSHLGVEDKHLKERMRSEKNLTAVLNWIVWGAVRYFTEGLQTPETVKSQTKKARDDVDYVGKWFSDNVTIGTKDEYVAASVLYQNYKTWCEEQGVSCKKQRGFSNSLMAKGIAPSETIRTPLGTQRVVHGLKIG